MALQVWLPLNGNLNNQGLANVSATNSAGTVNSAGKIGSCYGCKSTGYLSFVADFETSSEFSIAFWIKVPQTITSAGSWQTLLRFQCVNDTTDTSCPITWASYNQIKIFDDSNHQLAWITVQYDTWIHFTIVNKWDGTTNYTDVYQNGIKYNSYTRGKALKIRGGAIHLGESVNATYGPVYYNDVRIYDHCLSPKEVKEISKGLVLHYKLDEGSLKGSGNLVNGLSGGGQCTVSGSTVTVSGTNADTYFYIRTSTALTSGKTYKISCTGNFEDGKYYDFPIAAQANTGPGMIRVQNGYCSMVFTANDTIANAGTTILMDDRNRAPGAGTISNIMLEEIIGISDCSGYGRNGTITGQSISINNISPRYKNNTLASDTSSYSIIGDNDFCLPDGPLTLSFWSKPTVSTTTDTSKIEFRFSKFYYFTYINYPYFTHDTDYRYKYTNYWSDGNWHYVTNVYDGSSLYLYIDGILQSWTGSTTTSTTFQNELILKFRGNNLSDLRIYSTALSADDIKDLYQTSAAIHNTGNIESFEFVETNNDSKELNPWPIVIRSGSGNYIYLPDGSIQFSTYVWFGSDYIPISPSGKTYYYDIEYSNESGNNLYIGFEKYDSTKSSGSNEECQYLVNTTGAKTHDRVTGTINLSTANGNIAAYTRLRILNNWYSTTGKGTIHHISLKEVSVKTVPDINKNGVFEGDAFIEDKDASISHTGNVIGNQIIEI